MADDARSFTFQGDTQDDGTESSTITWESLVHQAVGAASMCWEHVERAGVFRDQRARVIADAIIERSGIARTAVRNTSAHREERDELLHSNQGSWVRDDSEDGGHMEWLTWREVAADQEKKLLDLEAHRRMLSDLDRNAGGRHQGDIDGGDPTGWSQGNPHLVTGDVIGYSIAGKARPYVVPPPERRGDVRAWIDWPE